MRIRKFCSRDRARRRRAWPFGLRAVAQHHRVALPGDAGAAGPDLLRRPGDGMAANGGLEFQRYAAMVAQQLQARGYAPAAPAEREHGRPARLWRRPRPDALRLRLRSTRGRFGYGGFLWLTPVLLSALRPFGSAFFYGWNDPFWYGGGVDSYVEYHSQLDLHIRAAGTNQPLFDGRAQARSDDQPARRRRAEPGRSDVHRFPGPQRRNDEDHDPDAQAASWRLSVRRLPRGKKGPAGASSGGPFFSAAAAEGPALGDQPSSWRVSSRMSASSSASQARNFSICLTAWITVV